MSFTKLRAGRATALVTAACIAFPAVAMAYTSSFNFDSNLHGVDRSYSAGTRKITFTTSATNNNSGGYASTFTVKLYRNGAVDSYIGKITPPRVGSGSGSWTGMSAGTYHYDFSKSVGDGIWLSSNNVNMS